MTQPQTHAPQHGRGPRTFPTRHALPSDVRDRLVGTLNQNLADAFDLYTQTKHAHWNVKGMAFYPLHLLFDELAETVEKDVDSIAERITALGGFAEGTARMAARASRLPEMPADVTDEWRVVDALVDRYAQAARNVGQAIEEAESLHDKGTADLLTAIVRDLDKALYLLESHTQASTRP